MLVGRPTCRQVHMYTHDLFARLLPVAILGYWCEMVNLLKKEISFVFLESQVCISVYSSLQAKTFVHYMY